LHATSSQGDITMEDGVWRGPTQYQGQTIPAQKAHFTRPRVYCCSQLLRSFIVPQPTPQWEIRRPFYPFKWQRDTREQNHVTLCEQKRVKGTFSLKRKIQTYGSNNGLPFLTYFHFRYISPGAGVAQSVLGYGLDDRDSILARDWEKIFLFATVLGSTQPPTQRVGK